MTIEYNRDVATCRGLGNYGRLLKRWKGSIYRLIWPELFIYMIAYVSISVFYRLYLNTDEYRNRIFEKLVKYCRTQGDAIPISFVLGFYVSQVVTRWWSQWNACPWPDNLAILVATHVQGHGERSRLMRRTIMRYVNLAFTMTMMMMSPQAKSRFPTMDHLVEAGFIMDHEKTIIEHLHQKTDYATYWVPIIWAGSVITRARAEGRIVDDMALSAIIKRLCRFRGGCGELLGYDWVNIPLVYVQVVTLAVYFYFATRLVAKQFLLPCQGCKDDPNTIPLDIYFPVFLFLEFFFYMGWLKVAETMVNPWGGDEDDFEVNWMIDRNFTVSYLIVDEMHQEHPELLKDNYWDEVVPEELPYTQATFKYKKQTHVGSAETEKDYQGDKNTNTLGTSRGPVGTLFRRSLHSHPGHTNAGIQHQTAKTSAKGSAKGSAISVVQSTNSHPSGYKRFMDNTFVPIEQDEDKK